MIKAFIHEATMEDMGRVIAFARDADKEEAEAMTGKPFVEALVQSYRCSSHCWVGYADIMPVCLFGVAPINSFAGTAAPWMIGTTALDDQMVARKFVRENGAMVAQMNELYHHLYNWVDARNVAAIRWLKWLGFEVGEAPAPFGPEGLPFHYFEKRRA